MALWLGIGCLVAVWLGSSWYSAHNYAVRKTAADSTVLAELKASKPAEITVRTTALKVTRDPFGIPHLGYAFSLTNENVPAHPSMRVFVPMPWRLWIIYGHGAYRLDDPSGGRAPV